MTIEEWLDNTENEIESGIKEVLEDIRKCKELCKEGVKL